MAQLDIHEPRSAGAGVGGGGLRATVLYDYEAAEDNEINLLEGQILTDVQMIDEGSEVNTVSSP